MGPHSFERGNCRMLVRLACCPTAFASMGPHSFERGNHFQGLRRSESWNASMGPHSFERGNSRASLTTSPSTCPLQWGLTLSSEETCALRFGRVATGRCLLQWGLTLSSEETCPDRTRQSARTSSILASMGPHSFERGNVGLGEDTVSLEMVTFTLQWGLTLSSEETTDSWAGR